MKTIERKKYEISLKELEGLEEMFYRQIQMSPAKAKKRFADLIGETRDALFPAVKIEAIVDSFPIASVERDLIRLEDGTEIESEMLAKLFTGGKELVFGAVTVHGYDSFEEDDNAMNRLFYDGWGTAIVERANAQLKMILGKEAAESGKFTSFSWSPGQHDVDIGLQRVLFEKLKPDEIGVFLNKDLMMRPKKSISGFTAVADDPAIRNKRSCDFCRLRDTCPSAYA